MRCCRPCRCLRACRWRRSPWAAPRTPACWPRRSSAWVIRPPRPRFRPNVSRDARRCWRRTPRFAPNSQWAEAHVTVVHAFPEEIIFAAEALRRGEVVAYPTETFYGLGVNALDELALARLRALKGRGADKSLSVLVQGAEMIDSLCKKLP